MDYLAKVDPNKFTEPHGSVNYPIFTYDTAIIEGSCAALSVYLNNEYPTAGVHEDHEGFYVCSGTGMAKVGDKEYCLKEGCCFYAPAGVPHMIKKDKDCIQLKLFLFHFKK